MDSERVPVGYREQYESGVLRRRVRRAYRILERCCLCPRRCGVNRLLGEEGFCRAGARPVVASGQVHHGEEPPISGSRGSGTIFFSCCTLRCVFCQNFPISHLRHGNCMSGPTLGRMMLRLQRQGCHNINLVTPTHFVPQILAGLLYAARHGLHIPLVYNCSGYESMETLGLLDGIVDIYLPDLKYSASEPARLYSHAADYFTAARRAIGEMYRQVGDLELDDDGIARRGILVRHLVLPNNLAGTREVLQFLMQELSPRIAVSLMSQYFPAYQAQRFAELNRRVTTTEYAATLEAADRLGLAEGWRQDLPE